MLLSAIGYREIPVPEHIDIYHLTREMAPSEKTALQCVMEVDEERIKLEKEAERLAHEDCELPTYTHPPCLSTFMVPDPVPGHLLSLCLFNPALAKHTSFN